MLSFLFRNEWCWKVDDHFYFIDTTKARPWGFVVVNGYIVEKQDQAIRQEIGVVFQESLLDPLLTVKENLAIRGSFYGMTRTRA